MQSVNSPIDGLARPGGLEVSVGEKVRTVIAATSILILVGAARPGSLAAIPSATTPQPVLSVTILFFTATWCEPCHAVEPVLEKFARKHSKEVRLVAIDFDHSPEEVARWEVRQIPVVILISPTGKVLLRADGGDRETLKNLPSALEDTLKRLHERS